ncbi:MAG TPA: M23 family metallopeptidase [Spirochaetota bacterium]|nr:M23 family metallopeptidase [Spirochaetota bacterium]
MLCKRRALYTDAFYRIKRAALCVLIMPLALLAMSPSPPRTLGWPIDRPQRITGTFCELRGPRFHLGLDVSTGGRKGFEIFAADDGHISTALYQKWGIGYAIFITHPDGRRTFYGHMDGFADRVLENSAVVGYRQKILDREDFRLEFKGGDIPVRKGERIGYSGDSGIGREHFHFEVRDEKGVHLNPLRHGLSIDDTIPPDFSELGLVPLDGRSHIDGVNAGRSVAVARPSKGGVYRPKWNGTPVAGGIIGITVAAGDRAGYISRIAVYRIELLVNGKKIFETRFDRMKREKIHLAGLYYDYSAANGTFYTHYLYSRIGDEGRIDTTRLVGKARVTILAYDANDNRAELEFDLLAAPPLEKPVREFSPNLVPGRELRLSSEDGLFAAVFDKKAALYPERVWLKQDPPLRIAVAGLSVRSAVYTMFPPDLCVDRPMELSLEYRGDDRAKVGLYQINPATGRFHPIGNRYDLKTGSFVHSSHRMAGFFLLRDDALPEARFKSPGIIAPGRPLYIPVSDIGSGIDLGSISLTVDGKPVKWDYDPDYSRIEILRHNDIWSKGVHEIELGLKDMAGNEMKKLTAGYTVK